MTQIVDGVVAIAASGYLVEKGILVVTNDEVPSESSEPRADVTVVDFSLMVGFLAIVITAAVIAVGALGRN